MEIKKITTGILDENCYIISNNNTCIVIDPGSDIKKIKQEIGTDKVNAVFITHMHFDHIGALEEIIEENKEVAIYKKSNLQDNETITIGNLKITVLFTPGHSEDSVTYYLEQEKSMFTGDFIFKDTIGRCDLPTGNAKVMTESLKRLKNYADDIMLYPGHGDNTTLGRERKANFYLHDEEMKND